MWICTICDSRNPDEDLFCPCCGRKKNVQEHTKQNQRVGKTLSELYNEGLEKKEKGDYYGAEECFLQALNLDPNNVKVLTSLGSVFTARGSDTLGELLYKRAIDLDAQYPWALNNYAVVKSRRNDFVGAKLLIEKCLSLISGSHPVAGMAHFNHGFFLAELGERSAAAEAWREAERCGYKIEEINEQRRKYSIQ